MTITIPDDILRQAGMTEQDALVEFACRLFQTRRLNLGSAARLAGMGRTLFEAELQRRGIPAYEITADVLRDDLKALDSLRN